MKPYLEKVKNHFDSEFMDFDWQRERYILKYDEAEEQVVSIIPFPRDAKLRMLDLGVGTGHTTMRVLEKFPNAHITGVDFSKKMLEQAQKRLEPYKKRVKLVQSEITAFRFEGRYDVIFSAITLHHLTYEDKKYLFKKIYANLIDGGCFINADFIKPKTALLAKNTHDFYFNLLKKNFSGKELIHVLEHTEQEDNPSTLEDEFVWLKQAGFKDTETAFLYYNVAVYYALK